MNEIKEQDNAGWTKRNIVDEPRLSELVEMYESLDFEVQLREFDPKEFSEDCSECVGANPEKYKVINTKKK